MDSNPARPRLLIEDWLPISEIGIESVRERTPMTPYPAPNRLHVWWARRPLVASRAAILASLLPADADRSMVMHILGIHGDPLAARKAIEQAKRTTERISNPYEYRRAFSYNPTEGEKNWIADQSEKVGFANPVVIDPMAGGGSIPFEAVRLGSHAVASELNPVAWLLLKATVEYPCLFGKAVLTRYERLSTTWRERMQGRLAPLYPDYPDPQQQDATWLWARTVACPYCGGVVPLSPNWRLDSKGTGVRLVPHTQDERHRHCTFVIVANAPDHSPGTVNGGAGLCPYPDCGRVIGGDEIKSQARAGRMGQQLYAVVYKREGIVGRTKSGKAKTRKTRGFRAPRPEDDVEEIVRAALQDKMPEWQARNCVPEEEFPETSNDDRPRQYGMPLWRDFFSPRQLYGHCTSVEIFQDMVEELRDKKTGKVSDLDTAAIIYLAVAIDKVVSYNSILCRWDVVREAVRGKFDRHDYAFQWSYGELSPTIVGLGYDWAVKQTGKALKELIELAGGGDKGGDRLALFPASQNKVTITHGSADALDLPDGSVDCIVMDPPYYDNVMYAELADFFYVWLKRTAGLLFPEEFSDYLTDKDREAVANPAKFKGQKGARSLAGLDYQERMAAIFRECRRVLKPHGAMTVMFTHKASGAWDALATGLVKAGFVITASWPVNTEAEGSLHIKEKSAARSTIFLVCRPREERDAESEPVYWENLEPKVIEAVRRRIGEFQAAGIRGVDLYLACFGPALQVFSEAWPLTRGRPQPRPDWMNDDLVARFLGDWDPYAVRPEEALDAARREAKRWRMEHLATVRRQHHLDPLTEWFILAWDAFGAPRFPSDEALKLARVVGLDFDADAKNIVCEIKGSDVILWDSRTRRAKHKLGPAGETVMLDTLHQAAVAGRTANTGAARAVIEDAGLLEDATLLTAFEAMLNALPPPTALTQTKKDDFLSGASSDFEALEKLRRLAFSEQVPEPRAVQLALFDSDKV